MIREFTAQDMPQVVGLLETLRRRTPYRGIKPDWPQIVQTVTTLSAKQTGCVYVAEHGKLTGVLIGVAQNLWWQDEHGARVASDLIFYSQRAGDGVKLLGRMVDWAFRVPRVVRIECAVSSGEDESRLAKIYEEAGFGREGSFFVRNHPRYEGALHGLKVVA